MLLLLNDSVLKSFIFVGLKFRFLSLLCISLIPAVCWPRSFSRDIFSVTCKQMAPNYLLWFEETNKQKIQ